MSDTFPGLTHQLAELFRSQHPALCASLEAALKRGVPARVLAEQIRRDLQPTPERGLLIFHSICVFLEDVDAGYRREEERRRMMDSGRADRA